MKKIKTVFLLLVLTFSASAFAGSPKKVATEEPTPTVEEVTNEESTPILKDRLPKDGGGSYQKQGIWDG